ncbi:hypothetical protein Barb7_02048 [Bacteroidales bacterium Barb7]|nr:hypothetical protein Barb7_02048 [Bacteroidales bacterium Barb7]
MNIGTLADSNGIGIKSKSLNGAPQSLRVTDSCFGCVQNMADIMIQLCHIQLGLNRESDCIDFHSSWFIVVCLCYIKVRRSKP